MKKVVKRVMMWVVGPLEVETLKVLMCRRRHQVQRKHKRKHQR